MSAICDDRALPSGVFGPHDFAPLRRLASARALLMGAAQGAAPMLDMAGVLVAEMGLDATAVLAQLYATGVTRSYELVGTGSCTYSIESRARLAYGREASLLTVVSAGASPVPGSAYTLLRWEEGAAPQ